MRPFNTICADDTYQVFRPHANTHRRKKKNLLRSEIYVFVSTWKSRKFKRTLSSVFGPFYRQSSTSTEDIERVWQDFFSVSRSRRKMDFFRRICFQRASASIAGISLVTDAFQSKNWSQRPPTRAKIGEKCQRDVFKTSILPIYAHFVTMAITKITSP